MQFMLPITTTHSDLFPSSHVVHHIFPPKFMSLFIYDFLLSSVSSAHVSIGTESPLGHRELTSGHADKEKKLSLLCFHFLVACLFETEPLPCLELANSTMLAGQ